MIKLAHSVIINRPVEEVFEFVIDPQNEPLWISGTLEAVQISEGPLDVGAKVRARSRFLDQNVDTIWVVTEYERNRRRGAKVISGTMSSEFIESYETVEGGTRISATGQIEVSGLLKLAEPLVARLARRQQENNFANLKSLMEAKLQE